jgi:outer membrane autotransporter protein
VRHRLSFEAARQPGAAGLAGARLRHRLAALLATTALAAALALPFNVARAQDATWLANPATNDFNVASNWSTNAVPTGTAFFGTSSTTNLSFAFGATIGGLTFNAGAPAYSFTNDLGGTIKFTGAGIVINGGSVSITNNDEKINFNNDSSAGSGSIINNQILNFFDSSTAGSATITSNSETLFFGSASGGTARLIANGPGFFGILFLTTSGMTAGSIEGDGTIDLGAKNLTVGGNNLSTTFSGLIDDVDYGQGSGGALIKAGGGTLTLSGANTYTGGTTISAGTIVVGNDSALGTGNVTMAAGSTLAFSGDHTIANNFSLTGDPTFFVDTGNTDTISGLISDTSPGPDAGVVEKTGTGTLILSGANTYSGGTIVSAGTLMAGSTTAFGSGRVSVASGATLDINGFDVSIGSLSDVSGSGGIVTNGDSSIATLTAGSDNTSTTFSGVIQDGTDRTALAKVGSGTLTLTNTNTYTGPTTVNAGTLSVNGSIVLSSGLTVNSGGTVGGTGTLPSTTIASGGALAPGNSIGTITVNGNLTFNAGSTYAVQVSPSAADHTDVTGTAALAGTVNAAFAPGSYSARSYTILSAAGLGGTTFDALTTNFNNFNTSLSYTATDVLLNLTGASLGAGTSLSRNQQNVADAINSFFNNGGTLPSGFVTLFGLSGGDLANALSQLSGEAATGGQQAAFQLMSEFLGLMFGPDADGSGGGFASAFAAEQPAGFPADVANAYAAVLKAPASKAPNFARRWRAWATGFGGYNATNGDAAAGTHDLTARSYGGAAGLDYRVTPDTVIGLALAGAGTSWGLAAGLGGGRSDAFQAGLYGKTHAGAAYAAAALAFANHWMSTDRHAFAGDHLSADFNAQSYGGRIEAGYRYALPVVALTPYAALQAQCLHTPGYSETDLTAGGFGLSYAARNATDTRSELGARFDRRMVVADDATLRLSASAAWAHD